jgi:hypothetical protein
LFPGLFSWFFTIFTREPDKHNYHWSGDIFKHYDRRAYTETSNWKTEFTKLNNGPKLYFVAKHFLYTFNHISRMFFRCIFGYFLWLFLDFSYRCQQTILKNSQWIGQEILFSFRLTKNINIDFRMSKKKMQQLHQSIIYVVSASTQTLYNGLLSSITPKKK